MTVDGVHGNYIINAFPWMPNGFSGRPLRPFARPAATGRKKPSSDQAVDGIQAAAIVAAPEQVEVVELVVQLVDLEAAFIAIA